MNHKTKGEGRRLLALFCIWTAALTPQGIATRGVAPASAGKFSGRPWTAAFTDVSKSAGFTQSLVSGGVDRIDYLVESTGGGLAVLDYDGDGLPDLFVVNGTRWGGVTPPPRHLLYRNHGDGTFEDVSVKAGMPFSGWGNGVTAGDYDGDGRPDLYITQWGQDILLHNNGDGTFTDRTEVSGLKHKGPARWGAGAAFLDYDRDGALDLFVSNYMDFDPSTTPKPGANPNCVWKGLQVACGPRGLTPSRHYLFHNDGKGHFTDVSKQAGILAAPRTFGLTAIAADLDDDGWPDIYVASDSTPSLFFRNQRNGTFVEEGLERGLAVNEDGREQAGMGVAVGDPNRVGRLSLFKTHFAEDTPVLYLNDGKGNFTDATLRSGLGVETRYVGWGAVFADFDNDGWSDLFWTNGHIYPEAARLPSFPYRMPALLFRNLGAARFEQIPATHSGKAIAEPHSSRGCVAFDFDGDGDLDIAIWNRNEPVRLLRNDLPRSAAAQWIEFDAPLHTRVTLTHSDGRKETQEVVSQSSFHSAPGPVLHFGLGAAASVVAVIRHAGGEVETHAYKAGRRYKLTRPGTPGSGGR